MSRAYIDGNREWKGECGEHIDPDCDTALDDLSLAGVYRHYHQSMEWYLENAIKFHGEHAVLLLDFHGFSLQPSFAPQPGYDIILGTANRTTVPHSEVDCQLAWHLERKGYKVFLPKKEPIIRTGDPYCAGYTTRHYSIKYNINAIQIEIASHFRTKGNEAKGKKLAFDMSEFLVSQLAL